MTATDALLDLRQRLTDDETTLRQIAANETGTNAAAHTHKADGVHMSIALLDEILRRI